MQAARILKIIAYFNGFQPCLIGAAGEVRFESGD